MRKFKLDYSNINFYNLEQLTSSLKKEEAELKKQLRDYYQIPYDSRNQTMVKQILKFEQRVDLILVRMHLAKSLRESRQLISHGQVLVNKQPLTFQGKRLNPGDLIQIKKNKNRQLNTWGLWRSTLAIPLYLEVNFSLHLGKYIRAPKLHEIPFPLTLIKYVKFH